MFTSFTTIWL